VLGLTNYLGQLKTALGKLTSTQAKTGLTALISELAEATPASSATKVADVVSKQHGLPVTAGRRTEPVIVVNAVAGVAIVLIGHPVRAAGPTAGRRATPSHKCRKYTLCKIHCASTCREPRRDR
jgi:hypothetical protein